MVEDKLLHAVGQGDRQAFGDLYMRMRTGMIAYATAILGGDISAAEDVVDEAFTDIWRRSGTIAPVSNAAAWIRRIVKNKAIDQLRKVGAREVSVAEDFFHNVEDSRPDPESVLSLKDERRWLRGCLAILNPDQREIITLCYFEGLSLVQIADMTGIPENTAKTRLFYARRKLRDWMIANGHGAAPVAARTLNGASTSGAY